MSQQERSLTSSQPEGNQQLPVLLPAEAIADKIAELADAIRRDYAGKIPTVIVILRGAFVFAADLVRAMQIPIEVEFIFAQSYHMATCSSGNVKILYEPESVAGKDILIIEDIIDTGYTLDKVKKRLIERGASSVKICALLDKPSRREVDLEPDYVGFNIPDVFVAGYGIDYAGRYRELIDICVAEDREQGLGNREQ